MTHSSMHRMRSWFSYVVAAALVVGCVTRATQDSRELSFDEAVNVAIDGLVSQTQQLPAFLGQVEAKLAVRSVIVDPMLDGASGQQTGLTKLLEQRVIERFRAANDRFDILPFEPDALDRAQYLLAGTITREASGVFDTSRKSPFRIQIALVDLSRGKVIAQAAARARDDSRLDTNPTPYYRDSPVLVKDKVVDGYIRTASTVPGRPADTLYIERVGIATRIDAATREYNEGRYERALALYNEALASPGGEQLRVLNGVYLATLKLGRTADAEKAFGNVVAYGLANNNLGVKFLFNPGTTDFWSDPKVSGPYSIWLRQIARRAKEAKSCMTVIGHTSRTGSSAVNDRLSQRRALYIKERLQKEEPTLAERTQAEGMGFRENIVGTGTDDARDALDRRVEFKVTSC